SIILFIPFMFALIILMFIPFVGSFAAGILGAFVGVWFFCAFLFYREGYMPASNAMQQSFSILKKKIIDYSVSSYVVSLVFQTLLVMLTLIPSLIIGIIAYNTIGFENTFFDSMAGRMFTSIGATLLVLLYIVYYMFTVLVSGIIYETAKEVTYGEDVYERYKILERRKMGSRLFFVMFVMSFISISHGQETDTMETLSPPLPEDSISMKAPEYAPPDWIDYMQDGYYDTIPR